MPSIKPLAHSVAIAIAALAYPQLSYSASDTIWDCKPADNGNWDCANKPAQQPTLPVSGGAGSVKSSVVAENAKSLPGYKSLDWVAIQRKDLMCRGRYVEPRFEAQGDENDPNAPVYLDAGKSQAELGGLTKLRDGVNLRQGNRRLSATSADVDQEKQQALFRDDVVYREPGILVVATEADVDLETQQGEFRDASFVFHQDHLRGAAGKIERNSDTKMTLVDGDYTFCPPGNEDWKISASEIELDKESGFGTAKHATLNIGPVPVFYAPTLTFPIDDRRKSGFLYPTLGYTASDGLDIAVPYYFNLAPNYDDTFTPRWIGERGLMLENEFRYLDEQHDVQLGTAYLPDDELAQRDRWLLNVQQKGTLSPNLRSHVDFTSVSDENYFEDLTTNLQVQRESNLDQLGELHYYGNGWTGLARFHSYQSLVNGSNPYRRLPQLQITGSEENKWGELNYSAEYVYFDRDTNGLTGADRITGSRIHLMPSISKRLGRPYGYVQPTLRLWTSQYQLDDQLSGRDDSPSYSIPVASVDSSLIFERDLASGGIQTLEPRLFALYVPDEDQSDAPDFDTALLDFDYQSLFRYNRFSGRDRIGDAQQISLGVTTRFLEKDGYEAASFSVGQAFYFDDRDESLSGTVERAKQSDIATQAIWNYNRRLRITLDNVLAYSDLKSKEANIRVNYKESTHKRMYFSYRFEDDVREQTDLHFIWPVANRITALGRWQYDMDAQQDLETVLGAEYESCCWRLQFYARRWLPSGGSDYDEGIYLRFIMKGLGSLNTGSVGFLEDITGFEERDEQDDF